LRFLDEKEIRQMVMNLVNNGLDATPQGGKVTLFTCQHGDEVVLGVKDEGSGIPPEIIDQLGTPFVTTKEKGTGLGLTVCYSIAKRHHALIRVDTDQKGTTT